MTLVSKARTSPRDDPRRTQTPAGHHQRRLTLAAVLAVLGVAAATDSGAEDQPWHRYREFYEQVHLDKFYALPMAERDKVELRFRFNAKEMGDAPLPLVIDSRAGRVALVPDALGFAEFPVTPALLEENPQILTPLRTGTKVQISLNMTPRLPPGLSFRYADLLGGVDQVNRIVRAQAGWLSFAAPRVKGVTLTYGKAAGQTLTVAGNGDARSYTIDGAGKITVPLDSALLRLNPAVTLSERPQSTDFLD